MQKTLSYIFACITCLLCFKAFAAEIIITSPFPKTQVIATYAQPGDYVKEGQLLARLDTTIIKEKLILLNEKKKQLVAQSTLTHKKIKTLSAQRAQRLDDQKQSSINVVQLFSNGIKYGELNNKIKQNNRLKRDIKSLSTFQQKQKNSLIRENKILHEVLLAETQLEELMAAAEIKAPKNGRLIQLAQPNTKLNQTGAMIGMMQDA